MEGKQRKADLRQRIRQGDIRREDVVRRLAELAFGKANDCVRLVLEENPEVEAMDLSLLSEVKRNEKGTVEVKLVDRLQVLRQLQEAAGEGKTDMEAFLQALQGGEGA